MIVRIAFKLFETHRMKSRFIPYTARLGISIQRGFDFWQVRRKSYYPNGKIILTQDVDRNDPTYFVCHLANRKREDATLSASIRATERRRAPGVVCCPVAPSKMPPPQKERLLYNQSFLSVVRLIIVY